MRQTLAAAAAAAHATWQQQWQQQQRYWQTAAAVAAVATTAGTTALAAWAAAVALAAVDVAEVPAAADGRSCSGSNGNDWRQQQQGQPPRIGDSSSNFCSGACSCVFVLAGNDTAAHFLAHPWRAGAAHFRKMRVSKQYLFMKQYLCTRQEQRHDLAAPSGCCSPAPYPYPFSTAIKAHSCKLLYHRG